MRGGRGGRAADGLLVALILAFGGASSLYAWRTERAERQAQQRERLNAIGQGVIGSLDLQLVRALESLRAASQMMAANPGLSREQFQRYGDGLLDEFSVISLLEWQPLVPGTRRSAFERDAARQYPGFRLLEPEGRALLPAQPRDEHVPVLYSWPDAQAAAIGVDMAFDPRRMQSKWLARDAGAPMASGTFPIIRQQQLVEGQEAVRGLAISAPVYRGTLPQTQAQRREQLLGYVAAVIELPTLLREALLRAQGNGLELQVFDQSSEGQELVFSSLDKESASGAAAGPLDLEMTVDVGSRPWRVLLRPQARSDSAPLPWRPLLGLLATLGVAAAVLRALVVRRRLERTEAELAADRQRLSNVIEATAAGTWIWSAEDDRLVLNERWAQMLGRRVDEVQPCTLTAWSQFAHPQDLKPTLELLGRHMRGETPLYEAEFRVAHRDGHWVWVQSFGRVLERDAQGRALRMAGTHLDVSERKAAQTALQQHALALEGANRRLQELAIVDTLTGAFNRRHFNEVCQARLEPGSRGQAVALCMLDIDHFKAYNDAYGHAAGDEVLRRVAQALMAVLRRASDALFRLGGEEFGVIFSAPSAQAAQQLVQQLCETLRGLNIPHEKSPQGRVTASFGLAWWEQIPAELSPTAMYTAADEALYAAKNAGRDRVEMRCF